MTALPIEHQDDQTRLREEARLHARAVLATRTGLIRSLGPDAMRARLAVETSERVGVAGSSIAED